MSDMHDIMMRNVYLPFVHRCDTNVKVLFTCSISDELNAGKIENKKWESWRNTRRIVQKE